MSKVQGEYDKNGKYRVAKGDKSGLGGEYTVDVSALTKASKINNETFKTLDSDIKKAEVGFTSSGQQRKPATVTDQHHFKNFIMNAVEDGFEIFEGPWGSNSNEKSIVAEKYDENLQGKFSILISDRMFKNLKDSVSYKKDGEYTPIKKLQGWFVLDSARNLAHSEHAITVHENYSYQDLVDAAGTCDNCGRNVGVTNLKHVAFANASCHECLPEMREKHEPAGWYN